MVSSKKAQKTPKNTISDHKSKPTHTPFNIVRTVRFGLQSYDTQLVKNRAYSAVVETLVMNNQDVKDRVEMLRKRSVLSYDAQQWNDFAQSAKAKVTSVEEYNSKLKFALTFLNQVEDENAHQVVLAAKKLKTSGFGKSYCHAVGQKNRNLYDIRSDKRSIDDLAKHFEQYPVEFQECVSKYDVYRLFVDKKFEAIDNTLKQLKEHFAKSAHNRERMSEIHRELHSIIRNLTTVYTHFVCAINISNPRGKASELSNSLNDIKEVDYLSIQQDLENLLESFRDPNNGFEVARASLHDKTLYKRALNIDELSQYRKWVGEKNDDDLTPFAIAICKKLHKKLDDIRQLPTREEKVQFILTETKKALRGKVVDESVTLWGITNALNNKSLTYDRFILDQQPFEEIGLKQRLRFALTVLVDCDVHQPRDFIDRCRNIRSDAEQVLQEFQFSAYDSYRKLTKAIKANGGDRSKRTNRGNLFSQSSIYKHAIEVNKELASLRGVLTQHIKLLEEECERIDKLQYYAILGESEGDLVLILANKEKAQDINNYLDNEAPTGNDVLLRYDSITWKSVEKLFNQPLSASHPFNNIKQTLGKDKTKNDNVLKFAELTNDEIKKVLHSGIAKEEVWEQKYPKLYQKLDENQNSIKESIEKFGINCREQRLDIDALQEQFPDVVVSKVKNGKREDLNNLHLEYFKRALDQIHTQDDTIDQKVVPEIVLTYKPQAPDEDKRHKRNEPKYNKSNSKFNQQFLEDEHRYWREQMVASFSVEFDHPNKTIKQDMHNFRVIGVDRGEKKIATICHVEYLDRQGKFDARNLRLLPIEYIEEDNPDERKYTYFLDAACYKVGKIGNKNVIVKYSNDENINIRAYEYLVRLQRTLWLKDNQTELQRVITEYKDDDDALIQTINTEIMGVSGLGKYLPQILADKVHKQKILQTIHNWKNFDASKIPREDQEQIDWFERQRRNEVNSVPLRSNIAANIAGVVNFLYAQNHQDGITTLTSLENLHNSSWWNKTSKDKTDNRRRQNTDFQEFSHNKLSGVSLYGKLEHAIINKLQLQRSNEGRYANLSVEGNKNYLLKMRAELKQASGRSKNNTTEFYDSGKPLKLHAKKQFGSVVFVDPMYTSHICPRCGEHNKNIVVRNNKDDSLKCKNCELNTQNNSNVNSEHVIDHAKILAVIQTGDENGAYQIAKRGAFFARHGNK